MCLSCPCCGGSDRSTAVSLEHDSKVTQLQLVCNASSLQVSIVQKMNAQEFKWISQMRGTPLPNQPDMYYFRYVRALACSKLTLAWAAGPCMHLGWPWVVCFVCPAFPWPLLGSIVPLLRRLAAAGVHAVAAAAAAG